MRGKIRSFKLVGSTKAEIVPALLANVNRKSTLHTMNHRVKLGYSDDMRADMALKGIAGKRLTYRRTNAA